MKRLMPILVLLFVASAFSKRTAPPDVNPIIDGTTTYSVPAFISDESENQKGGFVEGRDTKSGKLLWRAKVYTTQYDPRLERDVQDVFINSMSLDKRLRILLLSDEAERVFVLDLDSRKVTLIR